MNLSRHPEQSRGLQLRYLLPCAAGSFHVAQDDEQVASRQLSVASKTAGAKARLQPLVRHG